MCILSAFSGRNGPAGFGGSGNGNRRNGGNRRGGGAALGHRLRFNRRSRPLGHRNFRRGFGAPGYYFIGGQRRTGRGGGFGNHRLFNFNGFAARAYRRGNRHGFGRLRLGLRLRLRLGLKLRLRFGFSRNVGFGFKYGNNFNIHYFNGWVFFFNILRHNWLAGGFGFGFGPGFFGRLINNQAGIGRRIRCRLAGGILEPLFAIKIKPRSRWLAGRRRGAAGLFCRRWRRCWCWRGSRRVRRSLLPYLLRCRGVVLRRIRRVVNRRGLRLVRRWWA